MEFSSLFEWSLLLLVPLVVAIIIYWLIPTGNRAEVNGSLDGVPVNIKVAGPIAAYVVVFLLGILAKAQLDQERIASFSIEFSGDAFALEQFLRERPADLVLRLSQGDNTIETVPLSQRGSASAFSTNIRVPSDWMGKPYTIRMFPKLGVEPVRTDVLSENNSINFRIESTSIFNACARKHIHSGSGATPLVIYWENFTPDGRDIEVNYVAFYNAHSTRTMLEVPALNVDGEKKEQLFTVRVLELREFEATSFDLFDDNLMDGSTSDADLLKVISDFFINISTAGRLIGEKNGMPTGGMDRNTKDPQEIEIVNYRYQVRPNQRVDENEVLFTHLKTVYDWKDVNSYEPYGGQSFFYDTCVGINLLTIDSKSGKNFDVDRVQFTVEPEAVRDERRVTRRDRDGILISRVLFADKRDIVRIRSKFEEN